MLTIMKKVRYRLRVHPRYHDEIEQKLLEFSTYIDSRVIKTLKTRTKEIDVCVFTCESDHDDYENLCAWLDKDFKGGAHITEF